MTRTGDVEVLAISFPSTAFSPAVLDELGSLLDGEFVTFLDGLLVRKADDGSTTLVELDQGDLVDDLAPLSQLLGDIVHELLSDDESAALTEGLPPGSSAVLLVLEHQWTKRLRTVVDATGGCSRQMCASRAPVVNELLDTLLEPDTLRAPQEV